MIPVSNDYRRQLIAGNRRWLVKINMTLADGTLLELTNDQIWEGGITIDEATSSDTSFDIGSAVIGSLQIVIDNIKGNFSQYDFFDARLVLWLGVDGDVDSGDNQRYYRKGFYVVDKPSYNGSLITLECLDNMTWFDVPFEEVTVGYPATAGEVVQSICSHVGVTLGTPAFPNYSSPATTIQAKPEQKLNCREVLQYIAQMCCCYCKINTAGQLVLRWYDKNAIIGITNYDGGTYNTHTTPYSDGCELDGGHFNPWDGDSADGGTFQDLLDGVWISNNFQIEVSTDNVVVTGCRVRNNTSKENSYDELWVDPDVEQDHERYVLVIDNNPFIVDQTQAANVANIVGNTLAGLPIRGFTATSLADFSYETGDMATVIDFRGNRYYTWLTSFTFTTNISENFSCGVESLRKRSEDRFSGTVKTLAEANANAESALTEYDTAVQAMNDLAQEALGYYKYEHVVSGSGTVTWLHNGITEDTTDPEKPIFPNSTVIFKISGDGVFISDGTIDPQTGEQIYSKGYDANSGTAILNLIYAHGITADWIHAGTLTLGGLNNQNGWLRILNASGTQIGKWDKDGISASNGSFKGTISGSTITGSTINGGTINGASGYFSDGVGKLELRSGSVWATNGNSNGPGIFASTTDESLYACWGARNSAAINGSYHREVPTKDVIEAGHNASDERLKQNIQNIDDNFAKRLVLGISPKQFEFKDNPDTLQFGVIAQDVKAIEDECGIHEKNRLFYVQDDGTYAVEYRQFIAPMIKVIQSQQSEIDLLKQELAELKAKVK